MARRKSGSSIIFRLGVERFLERLSLFLALDLLLCVLFAGAGLWVVETRAAGILADAQSAEWTGAVELGGWSVQKRSAADGAQPPPEWLQGLLPEESEQAGRRLSWGASPSLAQRLRGARYTLTLDTGETGRERYIVLTAEIGPVLWAAQRMGIPTVIQEQNSYAGVTNKLLAKRARTICVSYEGMERFFPKEKIVMTGNPLRGRFSKAGADRREALAHFGFRDDLPVLLVVGGSLGTRTLNEMMKAWVLRQGGTSPVQVIWQTGKYYEREMREFLAQHPTANIWQGAFIDRMDYAYAAADLVVSRSGACTVSELCLVAKPTLFVPSPNVAEDHQTKNARALADKGAALLIPDSEAVARAMDEAVGLLKDPVRLAELSRNIEALAIPDSAERIVNEIEKQLPQSK